MDYNKWLQSQPPSNPNPIPQPDPYTHYHNPTPQPSKYPYYLPQPQPQQQPYNYNSQEQHYGQKYPPNPYPSSTSAETTTYADSSVGIETGHVAGSVGVGAQQYYEGSREVARQFGSDPYDYAGLRPTNVAQQSWPTNPSHAYWTNSVAHSSNGTSRKWPKKVKILQAQHSKCEVCKIDCTSKEVLDTHVLGKKHKGKIEMIQESLTNRNPAVARVPLATPTTVPVAPTPVFTTQAIGPPQNSTTSKHHKQNTRLPPPAFIDLETKRKKVLGEGAAVDTVRVCAICNVVCNSPKVFNYHLAGKLHIAKIKQQENGTTVHIPNAVPSA